ncbi:hypothetical protein Cgig2_003406 [Carnegiea gigantea]|uniref:Uncharacterized protein n=1 Tax=Carnegiea gigantea TaxID=171969 RepID=A0A9Q1K9E0_9CARY|nr:hypothetical protein Cgig2_003406 [Carnegiea gigantea]
MGGPRRPIVGFGRMGGPRSKLWAHADILASGSHEEGPSHDSTSNQVPRNMEDTATWRGPVGLNYTNRELKKARATVEKSEGVRCCVYQVPRYLERPAHDDTFSPRLVSIGPYHYGEARLKGMEFHKYRMLNCILDRTKKDLREFYNVVKKVLHQARASYQHLPESSLPNHRFLRMLVLDGCFVLRVPRRPYTTLHYDPGDPIFAKLYMRHEIERDILLLENQIPLFLMLKAFDVSTWVIGRSVLPSNEENSVLLEKLQAHAGMLSCLEILWEKLMHGRTEESTTIAVQEEGMSRPMTNVGPYTIPSVTALKEAGVIFKYTERLPFWEIKFEEGGVLEIPQIMIYESSEFIFLNLMAFELHHVTREHDWKITRYILFMDSLVNSAADVAELRAQKIIVGAGPSDEEIANLFNRLGRPTFIPFNQFNDLSQKIHMHCDRRTNRWRASLMHTYFNTPWAIISAIAAAVLLLLTILQTCYSIGQYYQ